MTNIEEALKNNEEQTRRNGKEIIKMQENLIEILVTIKKVYNVMGKLTHKVAEQESRIVSLETFIKR